MDEEQEPEEKRQKFKFTEFDEGVGNGDDDAAILEQAEKRRDQRRNLHTISEVIDERQEVLQDIQENAFENVLDLLNQQFVNINHTREGQQDAKIIAKLGKTMRERAKKLEDVSQLNFKDFSTALVESFSFDADGERPTKPKDGEGVVRKRSNRGTPKDGTFDWTGLGADVGQLFLAPCPFNMVFGPMARPEKVRNAGQRGPRERDEVVKIVEVAELKQTDEEGEEGELNEASFKRIEKLDDVIKKRTNKKKDSFPVMDILVDPTDQVQTVENFFDFAFLIKDGQVATQYDKSDKNPKAVSAILEKLQNSSRRQHVLTLNMKELHEVAEYLKTDDARSFSQLLDASPDAPEGDDELNPLHRSDALYSARSAAEQSDILDSMQAKSLQKQQKQTKKRKSSEGGEGTKKQKKAVNSG